ncbi:MAG: trypsin-like peptidase domain-containing protein [Spirochaetales bacterium]
MMIALRRRWPIVLGFAMGGLTLFAQSAIDRDLLDQIERSVYEVVTKKPIDDPLTYAEELPLHLLPFDQRNDEYQSIGTAFAVERDVFVTAAHVLGLEWPTLQPELYLRTRDGSVFEIDTILRYDNHRDVAVFRASGLESSHPLPIRSETELNIPVFAVGNAYGQGVIVRDGLLTSRTAERDDGAWAWLRYSAAASPGNSGGPLLDGEGHVVGIVTAKNESENLNFALPIAEALPLAAESAYIRLNANYRLPHLDSRYREIHEFAPPLPAPTSRLSEQSAENHTAVMDIAIEELITENRDDIFPYDAAGQRAILVSNPGSQFPLVISEKSDSTWQFLQPEEIGTSELEGTRYFQSGEMFGDVFFLLDRFPSDEAIALIDDPRLLLDTILEGYTLTRNIDTEGIRITSMGEAAAANQIDDRWGRKWLSASWNIPFADFALALVALPTPSGAVGLFKTVPISELHAFRNDFEYMIDFVYNSYYGTFEQWEGFLANREWLPETLSQLEFSYSPGKAASMSTNEIAISYEPDLLPIENDSALYLLHSFHDSEDGVRLETSGLYFYERLGDANRASAFKNFPPASESDSDHRQRWQSLLRGTHPYDARSILSGGDTHILSAANEDAVNVAVEDTPNSVWTLGLTLDGDIQQEAMTRRFEKLQDAFGLRSARDAQLAEREEQSAPVQEAELTPVVQRQERRAEQPTVETVETDTSPVDIFVAIERNDRAAVLRYVKAGGSLALQNGQGETPLLFALRLGNEGIAIALVEAGSPMGFRTSRGWDERMVAISSGSLEAANLIFLERPIIYEQSGTDGATELMIAAEFLPQLVRPLLLAGATATLVDASGNSPLHYAARGGDGTAIAQLVRAGADPDAANDSGITPRMLVAETAPRHLAIFDNE